MINISSGLKEILDEDPSLERLVRIKKSLFEIMGEKVRKLKTQIVFMSLPMTCL